jgi:predicted nucleotidyltransferase
VTRSAGSERYCHCAVGGYHPGMLKMQDRQAIRELATKYEVKKVLVFGSAARRDSGYRDIDLAIDGIRPQDFFPFYGELLRRLSLPVDLVDLSRPGRFTRMIREEGVPIYG